MLAPSGPASAWFAVAAVVAAAAWFAFLAWLLRATRPKRPRATRPAQELPGTEPPAVVNLLVSGCRVQAAAVSATLLDLAARDVVAIERRDVDSYVVRPLREPDAGLTLYERQVLDHVCSLVGPDGTVPARALTTGPQEQSSRWWKRFVGAVEADARVRGLTQPRWRIGHLAALGAAAVPAALFGALAFALVPTGDPSSTSETIMGVLFVAGLAWVGLMAIPRGRLHTRETVLGAHVASRWMALHDYLDQHANFADQPPHAVALWGRHLSYGAALGVAHQAVHSLPLGSDSATEAWTHTGGHWRVVRVRYPKALPPWWGWPPLRAILAGAAVVLVAGRIVLPVTFDIARMVWDLPSAIGEGSLLGPLLLALGIVVLGIPVLATVGCAGLLVCGLADLTRRRVVRGPVLRRRTFDDRTYLAVDDGVSERVDAWHVDRSRLGLVAEGDLVRVTVTPWLGHVSSIERARGEG